MAERILRERSKRLTPNGEPVHIYRIVDHPGVMSGNQLPEVKWFTKPHRSARLDEWTARPGGRPATPELYRAVVAEMLCELNRAEAEIERLTAALAEQKLKWGPEAPGQVGVVLQANPTTMYALSSPHVIVMFEGDGKTEEVRS